MQTSQRIAAAFAATVCFSTIAFLSGCEQKEKVLDIETPSGEIEVERSTDTGAVEVETNEN